MKQLLILFLLLIGVHEVKAQADPYHNAFGQSKTAVIRTIESFGANANDGLDDTKALSDAAVWFNSNSGNVDYSTQYGVLKFNDGVYDVGEQAFFDNSSTEIVYAGPKYQPIFSNIDGLIIRGNGINNTKIKVKSNSSFGWFDRSTHLPAIQANGGRSAAPVTVFYFTSNIKNVLISDMELNGSSDSYIVGARQDAIGAGNDFNIALGFGINIDTRSQYLSFNNLYIHNFPMDGIRIASSYDRAPIGKWNVTIDKVRSYWNGRQAFSWVDGHDLRVQNSEFSYTGLVENSYSSSSKVAGSPGCNIDIEPEWLNGVDPGIIRNGVFNNCQMIGNNGPTSSIAIQLNTDSLVFNNCKIKSRDVVNGGWAAIGFQSVLHRTFTFNNCEILGCIDFKKDPIQYGALLPNGHYSNELPDIGYTRFNQCSITASKSEQNPGYCLLVLYDRTIFDRCTITQVNQRPLFEVFNKTFNNNDVLPPDNYSTLNNCNIISTYSSSSLAYDIRGRIYNLRFTGNTNWSHNTPLSTLDGQKIFFQNAVINGSSISNPMNTFTFPDKYVQEGTIPDGSWLLWPAVDVNAFKRPIIIGETPCEYLQVYIGENTNGRGVVRNEARPLYIGEKVTLTVRSGSSLILSGDIYLAGKIVIESGANLIYTDALYGFGYPSSIAPTIHLLGSTSLSNINAHIVLQPGATVNTSGLSDLWTRDMKFSQPLYVAHPLRSQLMAPNEYLRSAVVAERLKYDDPKIKCKKCYYISDKNGVTKTACYESAFEDYHALRGVAYGADFTIDSNDDIKIYPNPTNDKVYISTGNTNETSDIQLLDINGRQLYKTSSKDAEVEMSLSKYPQGTYLIRISNASNSVVKKIVKTN